ncbi:hypothetical protein RhiJN_25407 [Ceratobasidium sp. AG-Ba]|nr:hypothetical protein RhiJN_25407 [Ceratobasidium sp. AG-Ba]
MVILGYLRQHKLHQLVATALLPLPNTKYADDGGPEHDGVMIVRGRRDNKTYIHPRPSGFDVDGKRLIEEHFGPVVSDWMVLWHDEGDGDMKTEVLEPTDEFPKH